MVPLAPVVPVSGRSASPRPYVPRLLLQRLTTVPDERSWTLDGSVVFVDISGFTKLSERLAAHGREGAEQVTDAIEGCFSALLSVAYANGGGLIKFGGDALLLLFDGPGHVERAARSAVWMRRMLREVGRVELPGAKLQLRMSVGMHSGSFHWFLVGDSHRELLTTGPAWTRTVEMEHVADAGEILVSPETAAMLPARCIGREKGPGHLLVREPRDVGPPGDIAVDEHVPEETARCLSVAVREHVLAGGGAPEHRPVTIAFLHFDGTDEMLRVDGAEATALALQELVQTVQTAVDRQGVCFLGSDVDADGGKIILTAGAPTVSGNDEERMLLALREIADAGVRIPIRIGVNRGSVFAGDIGPSYRRTYTVMGDAVNLAARLMAKAEPAEIYATADVLDRSATRFAVTELEPFSVKGKAKPVQAWAVGEAIGSRSRLTVPAERFPLVGRRPELASLASALANARAGRGSLVDLVGEPGIGKTRLLEEIRGRAADFRVLHATAEAYTSSIPYVVWRELLRQVLDVASDEPGDAVLERVYATVEATEPELLPWLPLIANVLDVDVAPTLEVELLAPEFRRPKLHETVIRFLRTVLDEPTIILVEDAHHMDEASTDLLRALVEPLGEAPWFAVVTRRGDGGFEAPDAPTVLRIDLAPLDPDATRELADAATETSPLPKHVMDVVTERSAGNPQFLLDLVRAASSTDGAELPESVEAAAMAQIDMLSPWDRALLRRASVLGVSFHPRLLEGLLEDGDAPPGRETWARLSTLIEHEAEGFLRFRRAVVRDAAYAGLPFSTRRRLHALAGARLEREAGEEADEAAAILSLHFFLAREYGKAWDYARSAGQHAADIYANVEAASLYQRALEAGRRAAVGPEALRHVAETLGDVRFRAGLFEDASKAYAEARKLCGEDAIAQAQLMYKVAVIEENMGRLPRALRWIGRARGLVSSSGSEDSLRTEARLSARYSAILYGQGRMTDATRWATSAIAQAESVDAREALAEALNILGATDVMLGRAAAEEHWRRAEGIYAELGDLPGQAMLEANLGALAYFAGRWDEALDLYERARQAREHSGDPFNAAGCSMNTAEVLLDQGRSEEAEAILGDVTRVYRAAGADYDLGICLAFRGRAALRAGRVEEAQAMFGEAVAKFEYVGAGGDLLEAEARAVECLLFTGEAALAASRAGDLLERAQAEGGVAVLTPHLERVRGYALTQVGDLDGARAALEASLAAARARGADHEVALTLQALVRLGAMDGVGVDEEAIRESGAILERLGVIAVPAVPLPSAPGGR